MVKVVRIVAKSIAIVVAIPVVLFLIVLAVSFIGEYKPEKIEQIYSGEGQSVDQDTLKILSWNIGYSGLGDDMDFFYDGGESMRTSEQRTRENLDSIISFLSSNSDVDFILLQEVDLDSHRSYGINQMEAISKALPDFRAYFAYNYNSLFVPMPLLEPMGGVKSGLVLLSRYEPTTVERHQYPGSLSTIVRPFNLKRAALKATFTRGSGNLLTIINTHNSAYDDGGMRRAELAYLDSMLCVTPLGFVAGDWNSTPEGYQQSEAERSNSYFQPMQIDQVMLESGYSILFDSSKQTTRFGYEPYRRGSTTETLLDFALISPSMKAISCRTIDLEYKNSDHNPVCFIVTIK